MGAGHLYKGVASSRNGLKQEKVLCVVFKAGGQSYIDELRPLRLFRDYKYRLWVLKNWRADGHIAAPARATGAIIDGRE